MSDNNPIQPFQGKGRGKYLRELDATLSPEVSESKHRQVVELYCTQDSYKDKEFLL